MENRPAERPAIMLHLMRRAPTGQAALCFARQTFAPPVEIPRERNRLLSRHCTRTESLTTIGQVRLSSRSRPHIW